MLQRLADPFEQFPTDLKLLIACMQLLDQGDLRLYKCCKALYAHVETQNLFTMHSFQSSLLLAIYEVGHAMYPQAYLSVGNCARLGIAMGLHGDKACLQMLRRSVASTEFEERRRAWWAVIILEMYVNLGSRHHPLACPAPQADDMLPQDDVQWDNGVWHSTFAIRLMINQASGNGAQPAAGPLDHAHHPRFSFRQALPGVPHPLPCHSTCGRQEH